MQKPTLVANCVPTFVPAFNCANLVSSEYGNGALITVIDASGPIRTLKWKTDLKFFQYITLNAYFAIALCTRFTVNGAVCNGWLFNQAVILLSFTVAAAT